ncbi:MAG: hypothetical protein LBH70_10305 [Spirochaetaceae bacterium]|nr:hypothetical protein [Spirochaetaceae bacterium]
MKSPPFRMSLFFLLFPLSLCAAGESPIPSSGAGGREDLVRLLREKGFVVEEPPPEDYGEGRAFILATLPVLNAEDGPAAPGTDGFPNIFIVGVPLEASGGEPEDPPEDGAKSFSFGVETAFSFLEIVREERAKGNQPGAQIAAAFLEDAGGAFQGLEDLAAFLEYPENAALVYLDFHSPPGRVAIHHGVRSGIAPLPLVQPLPGALERAGVPYTFAVRSHELYNLGLAEGPAALERARGLEIPAVLLASAENIPAAADSEALAAALADYAAGLQWEAGNLDTHYSLLAYGTHIFFLSEKTTLLLILFLAGIGIALRLLHAAQGRRNRRPHAAGAGPLQQAGPEEAPSAGGERHWADVCAHVAVFLAILGILGGTFIDLSCAPAFIWALAFTILGTAFRFVPVVFMCAFLSSFKGAETIFQTLREGAFTGVPASIGVGIYLILPFLFLVLRGIILIVEKKKSRIS